MTDRSAGDEQRPNQVRFHPAWDDQRWTALPHLNGVARADLCIVGLGGSGLAAIHAALDRGMRVIGIDACGVAGGAAGANGGFLLAGSARFYHQACAQMGRDRARRLYLRTLDEIDAMRAATPDLVRVTGSLRIAMSDDEVRDCETQLAAMVADGLPAERYEGPEGRGLLFASDGVFNPLLRCRRLAQAALQRGARLYENTPAIELGKGAIVTPLGKILCGTTVVAVDGKLEQVFPELQGRVRTARLQMLATAPTTEISVTRSVYARWGYEYWQQLEDGRIVLGGFRDHELESEWTVAIDPTAAIQDRLTDFLRTRLGVHVHITHRWAASVGYTPDALPVIEEVQPRLWAVGGYCGTGNVMGAICAKMAIAAMLGDKSALELLSSAHHPRLG